jgi:lupus La protein
MMHFLFGQHYFGDYNLPKDKFMKEQILLDDGWIPATILLKFRRLADLTNSPSAILSALTKSTSGLLEIDEAGKKVRRSKDKPLVELSEESQQELKSRSVYCKGFPRQSTTLDKALDFFKGYPTVINIQVF